MNNSCGYSPRNDHLWLTWEKRFSPWPWSRPSVRAQPARSRWRQRCWVHCWAYWLCVAASWMSLCRLSSPPHQTPPLATTTYTLMMIYLINDALRHTSASNFSLLFPIVFSTDLSLWTMTTGYKQIPFQHIKSLDTVLFVPSCLETQDQKSYHNLCNNPYLFPQCKRLTGTL